MVWLPSIRVNIVCLVIGACATLSFAMLSPSVLLYSDVHEIGRGSFRAPAEDVFNYVHHYTFGGDRIDVHKSSADDTEGRDVVPAAFAGMDLRQMPQRATIDRRGWPFVAMYSVVEQSPDYRIRRGIVVHDRTGRSIILPTHVIFWGFMADTAIIALAGIVVYRAGVIVSMLPVWGVKELMTLLMFALMFGGAATVLAVMISARYVDENGRPYDVPPGLSRPVSGGDCYIKWSIVVFVNRAAERMVASCRIGTWGNEDARPSGQELAMEISAIRGEWEFTLPEFLEPEWKQYRRYVDRRGWPFLCATCEVDESDADSPEIRGGIFLDHQQRRVLPLRPKLIPLIGNILVFAFAFSVLTTLLCMPTSLRRTWRWWRGDRCVWCGHLLTSEQARCPECGRQTLAQFAHRSSAG